MVGPELLTALCICLVSVTAFALWVYIEKTEKLRQRLDQLESSMDGARTPTSSTPLQTPLD